MTFNNSKINLSRIVMIKLKDKIKIRCMMKKEPLPFHAMLKQGIMWFTLASSNQETVYNNRDNFPDGLCIDPTMQLPVRIFPVSTVGGHHGCGSNSKNHKRHPLIQGRDHSTQIISCKPCTPNHHHYPSLTRKMRIYLELKDQAADSPYPSLNYPARPKMPSPQKEQNDKKETNKRAKSKQGKKQCKVHIVEKLFMLPAMPAAPIPASTSITMPMTTNPTRASTPWLQL